MTAPASSTGKPWIAHLMAVLAWATVATGVYLERLVRSLHGLDIDSLVVAAGFLTASSLGYGYNARRVKEKQVDAGLPIEDA